MKKSLEDCKKNIQAFADKHKIIFKEKGECGFGRECVGIKHFNSAGDYWINYNPINVQTFESIEELFDDRFYDIRPEDAYHKHDCMAVLGQGEKAIRQLSNWIDKLKSLNACIKEYNTGATGLNAVVHGLTKKALYIP